MSILFASIKDEIEKNGCFQSPLPATYGEGSIKASYLGHDSINIGRNMMEIYQDLNGGFDQIYMEMNLFNKFFFVENIKKYFHKNLSDEYEIAVYLRIETESMK